jgi:hypothetical protein
MIIDKFTSVKEFATFLFLNKRFCAMIKTKIEKLRLRGMENSCCGLKEMEILSNILKNSKVFYPVRNKFVLMYKASKDGFEGSSFHKKSDGKEKVLVIIKANGYIFGGYTTGCFKSRETCGVLTEGTFLFSLSNPENRPMKLPCIKNQSSLCDYGSLGNK